MNKGGTGEVPCTAFVTFIVMSHEPSGQLPMCGFLFKVYEGTTRSGSELFLPTRHIR